MSYGFYEFAIRDLSGQNWKPGPLPSPAAIAAPAARYVATSVEGPDATQKFLEGKNSIDIVADFSKWLALRRIDLIYVPVPQAAQIYSDRISAKAPADRIVAPQVRRMLLELSKHAVEVIDLLPLYLKARRDNDREPLFLPADPHWSNRAEVIAADAIGERLKRYDFVTNALASPARYTTRQERVAYHGASWPFLTPAERAEIGDVGALQVLDQASGQPFMPSDGAPILVIGDSYTNNTSTTLLRGSAIPAQLARVANSPVSLQPVSGSRTEQIKELLRDPSMLEHTRVVVWIAQISMFTSPWPAVTLPL